MYEIRLSKQAVKDAEMLKHVGLKPKAAKLLRMLRTNPYQNPPEYEKLKGYQGTYSRRINRQHRLVYQVLSNKSDLRDENGVPYQGVVKVARMWTHYE